MHVWLSGTIEISAPFGELAETSNRLEGRLVFFIKEHIPAFEIRSISPIVYGGSIFQRRSNGIESFESGEIEVSHSDHILRVRYRLGILSYLVQAFGVVAASILLLGAGQVRPLYCQLLGLIGFLFVIARMAWNLSQVRSCFRLLTMTCVNESVFGITGPLNPQ